jgi:hypothetical protein
MRMLGVGSLVFVAMLVAAAADAAELVRLTADNWDQYAPQGKEVDCILGDLVLRNDQLAVVIAMPSANRNANMSIKNVGGCIIDCSRREPTNDQLGAYFPGGGRYVFSDPSKVRCFADDSSAQAIPAGVLAGVQIRVEFQTTVSPRLLKVRNRYILADGDPFVRIETDYENESEEPLSEELVDAIRADRTFTFGTDTLTGMFWAHDDWYRQAYGVLVEGRTIVNDKVLKLTRDGSNTVSIPAHSMATVRRRFFPGADRLQLRSVVGRANGLRGSPVELLVKDPAGAVAGAKVTIKEGQAEIGSGRTDAQGRIEFDLYSEAATARVESPSRPPLTVMLSNRQPGPVTATMEPCGYVAGNVRSLAGGPIACKVAFRPLRDVEDWPRTPDGKFAPDKLLPFFGPETDDFGVLNLIYSADGEFRTEIAPGTYDVLISHGPEFDVVQKTIEVAAGKETLLQAVLVRSVVTTGWVSADFHSHSSPSGDNVSSQLGRVLNLLAEHVEFAPCTEHNRIDSYLPHLQRLGAVSRMGTCSGIELTGQPLPLNHQNAFPLLATPRQQDGGGPQPDADPVRQIQRLAMWDGGSEKLVQCNHPNIVQMFGDKELDGTPDDGFRDMFAAMDVIEVHPLHYLFSEPVNGKPGDRRIHHWLQLLNQGIRVPAVVNTDAHYNFHGSGWMRNYVRCSTDDPARIDTLEIVRACEAGKIVMTTGPFLEVSLQSAAALRKLYGPGEQADIPGGDLMIRVRVQCPNWLDVNRVQIFVNGEPHPELNFTRRTTPGLFGDDVVKFDHTMQLRLPQDAHVIAAAIGEGLKLSRVMGPTYGEYAPIAVANPIFVDVDGDGFSANRAPLTDPLPGTAK